MTFDLSPVASPNAAHLIVTFLDKAGVYAVLSDPNSTSFKVGTRFWNS